MYVFVFEDNPNTPSSKLLKSSYNGSSIYFSDGNSLIRSTIEDLLAKGFNQIIVFLDVNPNNRNTVDLYDSLSKVKSTKESWKNVIIVPIICIEYFIAEICKTFGYFDEKQLERPVVKYLVCNFDWDRMPEMVKGKSLEKIYKRLFDTKGNCQKCLDNRAGYGTFFTQACTCEGCSLSNASLSKKAEQLYTSLPVFDVIDSAHESLLRSHNIQCRAISLDILHTKQQSFYNDICLKMGKNRILINTLK